MGIKNWIPWQLLARKAAKAYGFNDPVETLERIRRFSHPSETAEPIELLRAGFAFHARGLANTKAIQNNLDWIWPYWIERQYDPADDSFIPRAFSFSHINLTQRNWTAVGLPRFPHYSIVDPRGLITPFHDSWSIDFWIISEKDRWLIPSRSKQVQQSMIASDTAQRLRTIAATTRLSIDSEVEMIRNAAGDPTLSVAVSAASDTPVEFAVSIRPYNPEGIQFVDSIRVDESGKNIRVNDQDRIHLSHAPDAYAFSNYAAGDVSNELQQRVKSGWIECPAGMATAAALYTLQGGGQQKLTLEIPIDREGTVTSSPIVQGWAEGRDRDVEIDLPCPSEQAQFEASLRTLQLLSPEDIYPGPYTYRRFWFRDACLIAHALLKTGQYAATRRALELFPERQTSDGYFLSQEGEWDSNGQVLWIYDVYERLTGESLPDACFDSIKPATKWICNKLINDPEKAHHGLLPPGFSAEHFGPNDFYYWDDFWAVGGLQSAARMLRRRGLAEAAQVPEDRARRLLKRIEETLTETSSMRARGKLPASPYRRMDSAAIGSLVSDYPLQLWEASDDRIQSTAEYLYENCLHDGAFFQDMIHSGLNVYLTLDLAQTFLRANDPRWEPLATRCLELASPTGQWPEAIHPRTLGGCMGDGQHAWAAAEWLMLAINRLVREEEDHLVIGAGVSAKWLESGQSFGIKSVPTSFGEISVRFALNDDNLTVSVTNSKPDTKLRIEYSVPNYKHIELTSDTHVTLTPALTPV